MLRSEFFRSVSSSEPRLACLVAGFAGKIKHFKKAIETLQAAGYDVVAFEYGNEILDKGEPRRLLEVVSAITAEVKSLAPKYDEILCTGVSLGAYIAINVQRRFKRITRGLYGTAGVRVSHVVFHARVFYKIRKMFVANGYNEASLREAWRDIDNEEPGLHKGQSIVIVIGGRDRIVSHQVALRVLNAWRAQGVDVSYFTKRGLGHTGTIGWYKKHLDELLTQRKS